MRLMAFHSFIPGRAIRRCGVMAAALIVFAATAARADDVPFQFDSTNWMSFNRYKEDPSAWRAAPPPDAAAARPPVLPPVIVPEPVALPTLEHPLSTPTMPGLDTIDSHVAPATVSGAVNVAPANPDGRLPFGTPDRVWESAASAARQFSEQKAIDAGKKGAARDIRFTYLPNPDVLPVFDLPHTPAPRATEVAQTPVPVPAATPQDKAACAAIDAYKKQQLEAIESDRRTLAALQGAIAQLGLKKQLNYLVDDSGHTIATAGDVKMNFPPAAPAPTKN